jgi:hypothetical protein
MSKRPHPTKNPEALMALKSTTLLSKAHNKIQKLQLSYTNPHLKKQTDNEANSMPKPRSTLLT